MSPGGRKGVTLVEALVSIVLVAMVLTCALLSFISARRFVEAPAHHIQAIRTAQLKLEELKGEGYDAVAAGGDQLGVPVTINDGGTQNEDFNYNGILDDGEDLNGNVSLDTNIDDDLAGTMDVVIGNKIDMFDLAGSDKDDAIRVTITVTWTEPGYANQQVEETLESLISKYGAAW